MKKRSHSKERDLFVWFIATSPSAGGERTITKCSCVHFSLCFIGDLCTCTYTGMATKTISIDTEAYRRLKQVQRENESFSQVIKRVVPNPVSTEELIELFRSTGKKVSDSFVDAVERVVAM